MRSFFIGSGLILLLLCSTNAAAERLKTLELRALDMAQVAREDLSEFGKPGKVRIAIPQPTAIDVESSGTWRDMPNDRLQWTFDVVTPDAKHLNFGFKPFRLPEGASLNIIGIDSSERIGPFGPSYNSAANELWTPILRSAKARLVLELPRALRGQVALTLIQVSQGYRGFGAEADHCKAGPCNMDVACLGETDPWNEPRRSVGAYTVNGSDACTGSLVNNTANDRRLLFITASHCNVTAANQAAVVVYWNYESPTCRTPGSNESGQVIPRPTTFTTGSTFLARTQSPFSGGTGPAELKSDVTMLELNGPANPAFNLFWAGWDRTATPAVCAAPASPSATAGLCASIHHPSVDEKRITFVERNFELGAYAGGAVNTHWHSYWDPTPPILPNIPAPQPTQVTPGVTEPGSSGSPLYNANQRLVGVLSGGPSACNSTGENLSDWYGTLLNAWEGAGTPATRMKDLMDPAGSGAATTIGGIGLCTRPTAPSNLTTTASANNRIDLSWTAVSGITRYRVFRTFGTCASTGFVQIAEVTGTTYSDFSVSGGSGYSYRVTSLDTAQPCESVVSNCSNATATGSCTLAPTFTGLASAIPTAQATCGINLNWNAASTNCGASANLKYNVYRSTDANFTPGPGNRLASCRTGSSLTDLAVQNGQRYYYVTRAEDGVGSGVCGGVEESNVVKRDAVPVGPDAFFDAFEPPVADWAVTGSGAGSNFSVVTTQAYSPTRAYFGASPDAASSRFLTLNRNLTITTGTTLEFFHRFDLEGSFDGGVLEYSLDGGTTWSDILAGQGPVAANASRFTTGGYTLPIVSSSSPLNGRSAFSGEFNTTWRRSVVNLNDFNGRTIRIRYRLETDDIIGRSGWWIDDVRLSTGAACTTSDLIFSNGFQ
jgi:lysyl endopeptidase